MRVYDEDAFFGSGEYEVRTVAEVLEYLTEEEKSVFESLCDRAEKRRNKAERKEAIFSRGYEKARSKTNNYKGDYHSYHYHRSRSRSRYCEGDDITYESYNDYLAYEYMGG